ncbi:MAG: hypothetical protein Q4D98_07500 [Planctomycetia bacterium]|nr:hypothetical protein [Planctomycetia bacterium]
MTPIVITLERFPILLPGCYGNTQYTTPGLDRFSLKSCAFHRAYVESCDPIETLEQYWADFPERLFPGKKIFLSDDSEITPASFFDESQTLDSELFFTSDFVENLSENGLLWAHFCDWEWKQLDRWLLNHDVRALLSTSGLPPVVEDSDPLPLLHHAEIQVPWLVCFSDPAHAAAQSHSLVTPADFGKILQADDPEAVSRERILLTDEPRFAMVTPDWFLTAIDREGEERMELYAKPGDWWEQNDVSRRCPEVLESLLH